MGAFLSTARGFLNDIGEMEGINTKAKQKRENDANLLEHAILGIQARTDLSPQEKVFQIGEARKQLQSLYEPHEGAQLFARLGKLFGGKGSAGPVSTPGGITPGTDKTAAVSTPPGTFGDAPNPATTATVPALSTPTQGVTLRPGMTIDDVLAAGSAQQPKPKAVGNPVLMANGTWAQMTQMPDGSFQPQPLPGYTEKSAAMKHLEDLQGYVDKRLIKPEDVGASLRVALGLDPKAGKEKQAKVDRKDGVTVLTDEDGNQYTSLKQIPKDRADLVDKFSTADKQFSDAETNKEAQSLRKAQKLATQALDNAIVRGDVNDANKAIDESRKARDKVRESVRSDQLRYNMMLQMKKDVDENPDAENIGSFDVAMLAFHLGMTTGAVRNMRQGKDTIHMHEAARSLPEDMRVAMESWVNGAQLSPEQRANFLRLAKQKMEATQGQLNDANSDYETAEQKKNELVESVTGGRVKRKKKAAPDIDNALDEIFGPGKK